MVRPAAEEGGDVTIYDVAKAAGVSPSTVSRAFSRPGRVSATTAQKIRQVADQLGYRARESLRPPASARPRMLGLSVGDVTNPHNFRVLRGCQQAAAEEGFVITLNDAQDSDQLERETLRRTLPLLSGLVVASSRLSDHELRAIAQSVPTVVLNRVVAGVQSLVPDVALGMRLVLDHLVERGHDALSYVAGPESWLESARWRALSDQASALGVTVERLGPVSATIAGGRAAAELVLERPCRALLATNDLVAIGLIRALGEHDRRVPDDLSVIGCDNIMASALVQPALTTLAAPLSALGQQAVRGLAGRLAGGPTPTNATAIPVRLIARGTTASPAVAAST